MRLAFHFHSPSGLSAPAICKLKVSSRVNWKSLELSRSSLRLAACIFFSKRMVASPGRSKTRNKTSKQAERSADRGPQRQSQEWARRDLSPASKKDQRPEQKGG